jgi:hypothetical protein
MAATFLKKTSYILGYSLAAITSLRVGLAKYILARMSMLLSLTLVLASAAVAQASRTTLSTK